MKDIFFNKILKKGDFANIYLTNGIKLWGDILDFNDSSILLKRNANESAILVFNHSIATITTDKKEK